MCDIAIVPLLIAAVVITALWYILNAITLLAPFKNIINIALALIVALVVITRVIAPLLSCAGL